MGKREGDWGFGMDTPILESYRPGGGGHAVALCLKSKRIDEDGRPYIWMANSWNKRFGNRGFSEWSPRALDAIYRDNYTVSVGLSDMVDLSPRPIKHFNRLA